MGTNERKRRRLSREILALIMIVVVGFLGFKFLEHNRLAASTVGVTFKNPDGSTSPEFNLELALDGPARAKGLMFRKPDSIPTRGGMMFVFPEDQRLSFWMKNTMTSLDMIFLDSSLKVQGVLADVPIMNEAPRTLGTIGRYVIELHAGTAAKHGIREGSVAVPNRALPRGR
ncbi:MAG: hypothetical protein RL417_130 [Pseudomonadota bacterium]|jgi:uncharacterized membrane protein (UPF0127 family)